jgi:hypothetical protein
MSKRKDIDNISDTHAHTICARFLNYYPTDSKKKRTAAREYCRKVGKTPAEVVAIPLPTYR